MTSITTAPAVGLGSSPAAELHPVLAKLSCSAEKAQVGSCHITSSWDRKPVLPWHTSQTAEKWLIQVSVILKFKGQQIWTLRIHQIAVKCSYFPLFKAGGSEIFPRRGQWGPELSPQGHSSLLVRSGLCDCWGWLGPPPAQQHHTVTRLAQDSDAQLCFASLCFYATCGYPVTDWDRVFSKQKANCWTMNRPTTRNIPKIIMTLLRTAYRESVWTSAKSSFSNHRKLRPEESAKKAAATARSNSSAIIIHNYSPEN